MSPTYVMIMDLDPHVCPEDHGEQFVALLRSALSAMTINVLTITCFPPVIDCPAPDLIVLRPAAAASLAEMIQGLRSRWHPVPIVGLFCAGKHTPSTVYHSLLNDVEDFLSCPLRAIDVFPRVQRLLQAQKEPMAGQPTGKTRVAPPLDGLVGKSAAFLQVVQQVQGVAQCDITVLLCGETGTGKEIVARAIHYQSARRSKPFVPVNCGALPDHLAENELFGHARGAYTDASSAEKGLVAEAEGGTLFLDEVDALSVAVQVKLLRFLQDREYRPLGCASSTTAHVRIIAATNTDLWQQVQAKRFREDLYYRLNIVSLCLPPLRERPEDIPVLARYFLGRYGSQYGRSGQSCSAGALHKLTTYVWPGNVRELETVIQRAVILTSTTVLQPEDIALPSPYTNDMRESDSFHKAKARVVEHFERTYLSHLLAMHGGNITRAAKHAGKERRAFQRLLHRHGLQREAFQT